MSYKHNENLIPREFDRRVKLSIQYLKTAHTYQKTMVLSMYF